MPGECQFRGIQITYDNLWKIYDRDKDYEKALQLLQNIEDRYADDYRLYKRFAFTYLETEWENDDGTTWDYSGFSENYEKAWQKYDALKDRNKDDNEMESLKVRYEELQKMGRIQ